MKPGDGYAVPLFSVLVQGNWGRETSVLGDLQALELRGSIRQAKKRNGTRKDIWNDSVSSL